MNIRQLTAISELESYPEPDLPSSEEQFNPVNLIKDNDKTMLSEYCRSIAKTIQFPLSTVYAHSLGCIAAAMNKSFFVELRGDVSPVNLYIVSSQPPSTGKSGVNKYLSDAINHAYETLNKNNGRERMMLIQKIKEAEKDLKGEKNIEVITDKALTLDELQSELNKIPKYEAIFTNATPEALEQHAFKQNGIFNIISDEAGSLLTSLGITYGDSKTPANADIVLQGWDLNKLVNIRVSREISKGRGRGVFSVLAQDETIDAILKQGDRGVGISERFLICRERDLLGSRNHMVDNRVDSVLQNRYSNLIHHCVLARETTIVFSADAELFIREKKQELEPHMAELGKYSNNVMRGVVGKMDKQVAKIASILHASENYENGAIGRTIELHTTQKAYRVWTELTEVYIQTADTKGFHGIESQFRTMVEYLQQYVASKGVGKNFIKLRTLISNTKNTRAWKGQVKSTSHFRAYIMPRLAKQNICYYADDEANTIKINPRLK